MNSLAVQHLRNEGGPRDYTVLNLINNHFILSKRWHLRLQLGQAQPEVVVVVVLHLMCHNPQLNDLLLSCGLWHIKINEVLLQIQLVVLITHKSEGICNGFAI